MQEIGKSVKPAWWFWGGILGVLLLSVTVRFWGLGRFNALVFDEVYYAKFANNYLTGTPFFDGHPPLSKYLIAIGIWIGSHLPIGQDNVNSLTGSLRSTWSYRWLNAWTGAFVPLVISAIAFELSQRRTFALLAGVLAAMDGLFLVESRYALNNVYLVIFGLLGQWLFLLSLRVPKKQLFLLSISGLFFSASVSIKWNGLWFLLSAYLLWGIAWFFQFFDRLQRDRKKTTTNRTISEPNPAFSPTPPYQITRINPIYFLIGLGIVPVLCYWLIWIPHIRLNPEFGFFEVQRQILSYHQRVGSGMDIHPYCSTWYSWIFMTRPVAYFYQVGNSLLDPAPLFGKSELVLAPNRVVYDVHAIGNPFLWWFSSLALGLMAWLVFSRWKALPKLASAEGSINPAQGRELWVGLFLLTSYAANLLPWVRVSRCVFLYHYMGASVFAGMALAWFVDRWLRKEETRWFGILILITVAIAFVFWMPIFLGLPLSQKAYEMRMWFRSWI